MFVLNPKLDNDTFFVHDFKVSRLLLMNNSNYPWFIMVPRIDDAVELTDLNFDDQTQVLREINIVANLLQDICKPFKLNIATLGNMVRQLHIHVIARFDDDATFPNPVWGGPSKPYGKEDYENLIEKISLELTKVKTEEKIDE